MSQLRQRIDDPGDTGGRFLCLVSLTALNPHNVHHYEKYLKNSLQPKMYDVLDVAKTVFAGFVITQWLIPLILEWLEKPSSSVRETDQGFFEPDIPRKHSVKTYEEMKKRGGQRRRLLERNTDASGREVMRGALTQIRDNYLLEADIRTEVVPRPESFGRSGFVDGAPAEILQIWPTESVWFQFTAHHPQHGFLCSGCVGPCVVILDKVNKQRGVLTPHVPEYFGKAYSDKYGKVRDSLKYIILRARIDLQPLRCIKENMGLDCKGWIDKGLVQTWKPATAEFDALIGSQIGEMIVYFMLRIDILNLSRITQIVAWPENEKTAYLRFDIAKRSEYNRKHKNSLDAAIHGLLRFLKSVLKYAGYMQWGRYFIVNTGISRSRTYWARWLRRALEVDYYMEGDEGFWRELNEGSSSDDDDYFHYSSSYVTDEEAAA